MAKKKTSKKTLRKVTEITKMETQKVPVKKQVVLWHFPIPSHDGAWVGRGTNSANKKRHSAFFIGDDEGVVLEGFGAGPFTLKQLREFGQSLIEIADEEEKGA